MLKQPQRRSDTSDDTRQRILAGALHQFAAQGIHGASLREISSDAGVPLSALHYHFGSKENLFLKVVEHFLDQLASKRLLLLEEAGKRSPAAPLNEIVHAFIRPLLELARSPDGVDYVKLQLRPFEDAGVAAKLAAKTAPTSLPFLAALERALPSVPKPKIIRAYRQMVWGVTHSLHDPIFERLSGMPALPEKAAHEELLDDLVAFYVAAFSALLRD